MVKLFVSGFPLGISELELVQLVDPYCRVLTVKIVHDKKTKKRKGFAFLEVSNLSDAENAVANLDGREQNDRNLSVKITGEPDRQILKSLTTDREVKYFKVSRQSIPSKKKRPRRQL